MTKKELKRWLEEQRAQTITETQEQYRIATKQLSDQTYAELGLCEVAGQIQPLLEEAAKLWSDWKNRNLENSDLKFGSIYSGLEYAISSYIGEADALYQRVTTYDLQLQSTAAQSLRSERQEKEIKISRTYYDLLAVIDSMSTAKKAAAYLTSLGFDLTKLDEASESPDTLAKQIDVSHLFVQKAA